MSLRLLIVSPSATLLFPSDDGEHARRRIVHGFGDYGPFLMSAPVFTIEEQTVVLPVRFREATSVYASFLVPAAAVKRLLPAGLTPLQTIPGRATCTIVGVDYREGDLGRYHEVGVCFLLRPQGGSRLDVVSRVRNQAPAYIHRLRVTTSFSCEAGRHIWGFPK